MNRPPPLTANTVHVWRASLALATAQLDALYTTLSIDECARADRSRAPVRDRWIAARGQLREILARYLAISPQAIAFTYGAHGKPALQPVPGTLDLRFNLAHSADHALYAITLGREVGVDLEYRRARLDPLPLAQRFFSPRETAALAALPEAGRHPAFFNVWTRKEAYLKARGLGLSHGLDTFSVALGVDEPLLLNEDAESARWRLIDLACDPDYAAALAVEGHDWAVVRCDL